MSDSILANASDASLDSNVLDDLPLPYLELDRNGYIIRANRAALDLHPEDRGNLIGKMAWDLVAADEIAPSFAAYCSMLETHQIESPTQRTLYDNSGQFRTYEVYRSLIFDTDGRATGMRMVNVDITDKLEQLAESRRSALWFKSALASLPEAVLLTDAVGIVLYINPAAELLFGWHCDQISGRQLELALPLDLADPINTPAPCFSDALEKVRTLDFTVLNSTGRSLPVEFHSSPIYDQETGHITGVVNVIRHRR